MNATVLIPTYNRARALDAVWPSYLGDPAVRRIIVVDDASTDDTAAVVRRRSAESDVPVTLLQHETRRGQQASRETAFRAADTEWVLFGEDDVWLEPGYTSRLIEHATTLRADAVAGRLIDARVAEPFDPSRLQPPDMPQHGGTHPPPVFDLSRFEADFSRGGSAPVRAPYLHSIALIRRELLERVPFDRGYGGNGWREETDFYLAAGAAGARIFLAPDVACYHLRGPISASGGQRIPRLEVELYAWRNTRRLVTKHWDYLQREYGFSGSPDRWMAGYFLRRQRSQLVRVLRGGFRSSFRGAG